MKSYPIRLKDLNDFRNYAGLIAGFPVGGYVRAGEYSMNMYCILELMAERHPEEMELVITEYYSKDIPLLEKYLEKTGILNRTAESIEERTGSIA